jgi:alcohol dehydrogenase (cytochrome c)
MWRFYTTAGPGEPGDESWGSTKPHDRTASPWGLPGAYDPVRNLIYWGIGNPSPYPRLKRHYGNIDDIPRSSPADLYSDSTVALDPKTGKLAWYFQQLPGDDWDLDGVHERLLIHTPLNPDPNSVKYINPKIRRGEQRDIVVDVPEEGGVWVNDRGNGQFLWAEPFPYDTPNWAVSHIDVDTGKTYLNWDLVFKTEGERHTVCYEDQKGWYPMSYSPITNSLYIPYNDYCIDMQEQLDGRQGWKIRNPVPRPGSDPNLHGGIAKVSMETGKIERFYNSEVRTTGATLATAGNLIFWGDASRRFRAFDAVSGKILWETILGGPITSSTITYAVNGKQYVAVLASRPNTMYVFGLPEKR